ncbi:MAG: uncharacterized protein KVP18_002276, partial [Porospora cf. gigantea A]|uniref:uncharacterized protein n=1 Tax=Porospora cf. gigantea A TaxID=2853593 RepID=UPI00355A5A59
MALTVLGLGRSRQREPNATVLISDRSLLATVFQWGHASSIGVARWFLGVPPLSLYHPEDTTFIVTDLPEEVTRNHIRRRGRRIGDISEETFYFGFNGTRIREVKRGLARFVQQLKAVYDDVQVVRTTEGRTSILRQLDLLPPVPLCGAVTAPKVNGKSKSRAIQWTPECTAAVQLAVQRLSESVLTIPVEGDEYLLETDASSIAVGSILSVKREDRWLPVAFHSKALTGPMERWPVYEQEAFAIVEGVRKFDAFLRGRAFTVHTDHASLRWMLEATKGKVARWASRLAEYEMTILHKSGTSLSHVDFLSRYLVSDPDPGLEPRMTLVGTVPSEEKEALERAAILRILDWAEEPPDQDPPSLSDCSEQRKPEAEEAPPPEDLPDADVPTEVIEELEAENLARDP